MPDFSCATGEVRVVRDVSFDIAERETLALAGESGSAKTTIGRTILRLVEATDGDITKPLHPDTEAPPLPRSLARRTTQSERAPSDGPPELAAANLLVASFG